MGSASPVWEARVSTTATSESREGCDTVEPLEDGRAVFHVTALTEAFIRTSTSRRDLREFLAKWWPESDTRMRRVFIDGWIAQHGTPPRWR